MEGQCKPRWGRSGSQEEGAEQDVDPSPTTWPKGPVRTATRGPAPSGWRLSLWRPEESMPVERKMLGPCWRILLNRNWWEKNKVVLRNSCVFVSSYRWVPTSYCFQAGRPGCLMNPARILALERRVTSFHFPGPSPWPWGLAPSGEGFRHHQERRRGQPLFLSFAFYFQIKL